MGGGKKTTVGYKYSFSIHKGLSRGPLNLIKHVKVGGLTAWEGSASGNTDIQINQPSLFGGDEKEGGVVGTLSVFMGGAAQVFSSTFKALMGGLVPDFRGVATLFWRGQIGSNNPYPKPWTFRVARWADGWDLDGTPGRTEPWYEAKALILMADGEIHAMNPAHIIYQCFTDRRWGRGLPPDLIDEESFTSAANTLCAEMFGLCLKWNRQEDVGEFIKTILSHIGGTYYDDPATRKVGLRLIRADYDPDELPVFDYTSGLLEVIEDETGAGDSMFSEVIVTYTNPIDGSEASVSEKSIALQQANGDVASTTAAYPGVPTAELALRLARRDLDMQAANRRFKVVLDRRGWRITPGLPFKISAPDRGLSEVIVRAGQVEDGEMTDGRITVTAVEDFFGLPASSYSEPELPGAWSPPDNSAVIPSTRRLEEANYRDLALAMSDGDLAALADDASLFVVLAKQPSGTAISYDIASAAAGENMAVRGNGNWTPTETIDGALGYYDTLVAFDPSADLSAVQVDEAILVDDEIMRVDAVDNDAKTISVARGCADTLPQTHVSGARAWFYEDLTGTDGRDYAATETVSVEVLTITPSDRLDIGEAPEDTIEMGGRQARPYPPGGMRVNGDPFGALGSVYGGEIELTWTHRDRVLQDDRLVEHEAANIGPEAGTTYTIRVYDGTTLLRTTTGVTADNWTYDAGMIASDGEPAALGWWFEIESERDGLVSWQKYRFFVPRRAAVTLSGGTAGAVIVAGVEGGSVVPSRVSITGGEPGSIVITGNE